MSAMPFPPPPSEGRRFISREWISTLQASGCEMPFPEDMSACHLDMHKRLIDEARRLRQTPDRVEMSAELTPEGGWALVVVLFTVPE